MYIVHIHFYPIMYMYMHRSSYNQKDNMYVYSVYTVHKTYMNMYVRNAGTFTLHVHVVKLGQTLIII